MNAINNLYTTPYKSVFDNDMKFIPTGYPMVDEYLNDLPTKKVTVLTGIPKEGKSTFLHRALLHAVDKGYRVLLVDGEHDQATLINKLYHIVIGNEPNTYDLKKLNKMTFIEPKPHVIDLLRNWHKDRLHIFSKYLAPFNTLEQLFGFIEPYVDEHKIDLVIADNLMMLVDGTAAEKNENQAKFMKRICDLAKFKNCHCVVVAHPHKGARKGEPMDMYDVLGASEIVNLVDYLIQVMRVYNGVDADGNPVDADAYARVILNRTRGRNIGDIPLVFDQTTESLYQMNRSGDPIIDKYDWKGRGAQKCLKQNMPF